MTAAVPSPASIGVLLTVLVSGVLSAVLVAGAADASAQQPDAGVGEALYGRDCAGCHGADGEGSPRGVPIADAGEAGAHYVLVTGRMPLDDPEDPTRRSPSPYSDEEIAALTDHVARLGDGPALPRVDWRSADVAAGGTLYRLHCGVCHSATAIGGALAFGHVAPSLMESEPSVIGAAVTTGPGAMPAFAPGSFTDAELASVTAYLQEIQDPVDRGGWPMFRSGRPDEALMAWFVAVPALLLVVGWIARRAR